jgi:sulfide dehydrogenase cytochrome subunit
MHIGVIYLKLKTRLGGIMAQKGLIKAILATGLAFAVSSAIAADKPAEKPATLSGATGSMLANTCAGCHGTNGVSSGPASPSIAGFNKEYFVVAMNEFKEGKFPSTIMSRIATGYSDEEIKAMAEFFAKQKYVHAKQDFDKAKAEQASKMHEKYCEKCHEDGGSAATDETGFLAGQWSPYIRMQLKDYMSGSREASKKMAKKLEELHEKEGDAGYEALVHYYASQQ